MTGVHEKLKPGCRVMLRREFLRNTGQFTGPDAPTWRGPFARGQLACFDDKYLPGTAKVLWDDGKVTRVKSANLWPCGIPEPA